MQELALFDLDNTLIAGDSDHLWGEFLARRGVVPAQAHRRENDRFLREYRDGTLDVLEFLAFQFRPLAENSPADLARWRAEFVVECIRPLLLPRAVDLVEDHRRRGHVLLIVTSTNSFITQPIAEIFGVDGLLATEPERNGDGFTGAVSGIPCSGEGKVSKVNAWLREHGRELGTSWFYTDSFQDLPLLEAVTAPVAVDPDDRLRREAQLRSWPIVSLR